MDKIRLLLRDLRQSRTLSQEELAQELGISRQSVISLEQGEYFPSFALLISMMSFFECNLSELVDGLNIYQKNNDTTIEEGGDTTMQLAPWSPFQAIDRMHDEMNNVVERTFGRGDWSQTLGTVAGAMNIHETDKQYEIEVQVPGYSENEISLEMTEDMLTISGTKQHEEQEEKKSVIRREWQHSEFSRSIRFATPIKEDKVEAKLENGTLFIAAPKVEPTKPKIKKIEVKKK